MSVFPTVLVAGDHSSADARLLDFVADRVRNRSVARVVLVHATNHAGIAAVSTGYTYDPAPFIAVMDEELAMIMAAAKNRLLDAGVASVETAELEGPRASAVIDYACTHPVNAIIMGTQGRTGLARLALGSVADGVLRSAHVPTFTLRTAIDMPAPSSGPLRRLLVAVDAGDASERILRFATALAGDEVSQIRLCHVVESSDARPNDEYFDANIAQIRAHDISVSSTFLEGAPAYCVLKEAAAWNADAIVIGTRGYRGVQRLILGSVAEGVICGATVPVLTIPPPTQESRS